MRDIPLHFRVSERAHGELFRLMDQIANDDPVASIFFESDDCETPESCRVTFYDRATVEGLLPGAVRNISGIPFVFGAAADTAKLDGAVLDFREGCFVVDSMRC